jgi:hypothetical protein
MIKDIVIYTPIARKLIGKQIVIVKMENYSVERRFTGETEVPGENLSQRLFVHYKSHLTRPGIEPRPPRWEASD